jgi:hypothetical protein
MNALYSLYDALVSINVPTDKARAVVDAMEDGMTTPLATKADLAASQLLLKKDIDTNRVLLEQDIAGVTGEIQTLRQSLDYRFASVEEKIGQSLLSTMTIRLGGMMIVGVRFTALRLV